jgi:hypothetical protein
MNKTAIQRYAIWARNELISQVKQRAYYYGIDEKGYGDENAIAVSGHALSNEEISQRKEFIRVIREHGFTAVVEEVAYTWFNRLAALRYMEVNDFLPSHIRVFSDVNGNFNPEILKDVLHIELEGLDKKKVADLLNANKTDDLYRYLLLTQCNALNSALPEMFEKLGSYTEMLLPANILKADSVVGRLVSDIPEEDWKDAVQIIGWLYQYYNTEPKQAVFDGLKKNIKITKEKIPAATQLFTPDWIVRYMVENSLGRLWLEGHPDDSLKSEWKYYLDEAEQTPEVTAKLVAIRAEYRSLNPEDIKVIDPCMGSGHILVYAFDLLMQIYRTAGYSDRDAAKSILENNLYGLDIDRRAYQLAYFSLMMKARQYNRRIFTENVRPQVYHPMGWSDGEEYGSLIKIDDPGKKPEPKLGQMTIGQTDDETALRVWNFKRLLSQKYDVVVTNPPYMGNGGMNATLSDFVNSNYPNSKRDTFSAFIEQCCYLTKKNKFYSMITMQAWMKLGVFETIRSAICSEQQIVCLAELADMVLGIAYESSAFIIRKSANTNSYYGVYSRIETEIRNDESAIQKDIHNTAIHADQKSFSYINGTPIAYNLSKAAAQAYNRADLLESVIVTREGMTTGDNDTFLKFWFEIAAYSIGSKWFPYNKGGEFHKWSGNDDYVVDWENDGQRIKSFKEEHSGRIRSHNYNGEYSFKEGITWSAFSSRGASFRYSDSRYLFDSKGSKGFCKPKHEDKVFYVLSLLNSNVGKRYLDFVAGAKDKKPGHIISVPIIINSNKFELVNETARKVISLSRADWDAFETSWDFKRHPLVEYSIELQDRETIAMKVGSDGGLDYDVTTEVFSSIENAFDFWREECEKRFSTLKSNEEELNRIFIDIYGLQDELTPEVEDKDVTVRRVFNTKDDMPEAMRGSNYVLTKADCIKSLISYAVGCMFGRYSLDVDGLVYAGGDWDNKFCRWVSFFGDKINENVTEDGELIGGAWAGNSLWAYDGVKRDGKWIPSTIKPDKDNILPITDDDYFDDDIVGRFVDFVKTVYGENTLEENLRFIADALGGTGTPREVIRKYFLNDFYKDHLKIYKKRPIYWLFDSGKQNGFKALMYLHRYKPDMLATLRTDYVHEQQERYRTQIKQTADVLETATGSERTKLLKRQEKLYNQAQEIAKYEEKVHHLSDMKIELDLDDGVKRNYEKLADVLGKI